MLEAQGIIEGLERENQRLREENVRLRNALGESLAEAFVAARAGVISPAADRRGGRGRHRR